MRLGIISDSHHYYDQKRQLYNLTILTSQFGCWANLFDEVIVCAPLLDGPPPSTHSRYQHRNICLLPIVNAGGNTFRAKIDLVSKIAGWWKALNQLLSQVDAVHIRCPNNISILGLLLLQRHHCFQQALYTGSWQGYPGEPYTYRWQRWYLRRNFKGPVAVYKQGEKDGQSNIISTFSPSYRDVDWQEELEIVTRKLSRLRHLHLLPTPIQLVSIGSLNRNKNQQLVVQAVARLRQVGVIAELSIAGDGPMKNELIALVHKLRLENQVHLCGTLPHRQIRELYRSADFVIQAPYAEGYGKVPVEAFFYGAIPIISDVDLSRELIGDGLRGRCFVQGDVDDIVNHIVQLANDPITMIGLIENGRQYARTRTLEAWQEHIKTMLEHQWQITLPNESHENESH